MGSEGFSFNSGGLEVGLVFAQRCLHVRNRSQVTAVRALSLTVGPRSQNVTKSSVGGRFHRKQHGFVAFCDMRGGSVCVLRGRRNTLEARFTLRVGFFEAGAALQHVVLLHRAFSWQAQHFATWRRRGCFFLNRSVKAAQT